jgi:hypothetical protein
MTLRNLHPDPDPAASSEAAPDQSAIDAANAAAGSEAVTSFEKSVRNLTAELEAASAARAAHATNYQPPAPAPVAAEVLTPEKLTKIAEESGFGAATEQAMRGWVAPAINQTISNQAKQNLREIQKDSTLGPVYRKNETAIKNYLRDHNINDAYLASEGYEDIIKVVAFDDFVEQRAQAKLAEAAEKAAKEGKTALGTGGTRPRSEGVHTGPVGGAATGPAGQVDDVAAAANLKVNPRRIQVARDRFGLSEADYRQSLLEMVRWEQKLGTDYVEKNGMPICELSDVMPTVGGVKVVPKEFI